MKRIGLIGARGHVGRELLNLVNGHPQLAFSYLGSRGLAGTPMSGLLKAGSCVQGRDLRFEPIDASTAAEKSADVVVLALPNGLSAAYVEALSKAPVKPAAIVDLSADHRFDDSWRYGLVERCRSLLTASTGETSLIANPGCYATAAQLALGPIAHLLSEAPRIFGVSGYSGAGTKPSTRNDPEALRDNLMPYAPIGHVHEREISRHLGYEVRFMPHVASFFRGITLTIDCSIHEPMDAKALLSHYQSHYANEALVDVQREAPLVRATAHQHGVQIGGFSAAQGLSGDHRVVLVATIDNLLKGAATQALQNINLALGLPELAGIH